MWSTVAVAKINLGLKILYKRPDGYHQLNSIFIATDWGDTLSMEMTNSGQLELVSQNLLPTSKRELFEAVSERGQLAKNILTKTYLACQQLDLTIAGVKIHLKKRIPPEGGLGGGSSNAAALIRFLMPLKGGSYSQEILSMAGRIGADVPFFLGSGHAKVSGIGECIQPITIASGHGVIITPDIAISTRESFKNLKKPLQKNYTGKQWDFLEVPHYNALQNGDWQFLRDCLGNDFEPFVLQNHPGLEQLKNDLYDWGCSFTSMTGSGSSFYGLVTNVHEQNSIIKKVGRKYPSFFVVPFSF